MSSNVHAESSVRRIWILQEFALPPKLKLQLGERLWFDVNHLIISRAILRAHSGVANASYLGHSAPSDPKDLTTRAVAGALGADIMESERIRNHGLGLVGEGAGTAELGSVPLTSTSATPSSNSAAGKRGGGDLKRPRLVELLASVKSFHATDNRDKVYALLGLAEDGDDEAYGGLVSYAPEVTAEEVYTRFAGAIVKRGEGFKLLLQAGITENRTSRLPSWVPVSVPCGI